MAREQSAIDEQVRRQIQQSADWEEERGVARTRF